MNVQVEAKELSQVRREIHIEVDLAQVTEQFERVVAHVTRNARIPGFRPGKIPRGIIQKRFAREIDDEVMGQLVPGAMAESLRQTGLEPVHEPVVRDVALALGQPLRFTISFEVLPVIEAKDYRGVPLRPIERNVEEADVARELETMRQAAAEYVSAEPRPLAAGDHALIDMTVREGAEDPTVQPGVMVEVGGEEYHPEFGKSLAGMSPGDEKSFTIQYTSEDPDPRARGKSVAYTVRVKELKNKVLPDLDDEFAKDTGRHESLGELRSALRADLEKRLAGERRRSLERQLMDALEPGVTSEVPQALVERELDHLVEDQARMLLYRGIDPRTAPIDWRATREKMKGTATRKVRWEILLRAIATKEGIVASDEDLEKKLRAIAEGARKSYEFVRTKIEKDGQMEGVRSTVVLESTIDFLLRDARMEGGNAR